MITSLYIIESAKYTKKTAGTMSTVDPKDIEHHSKLKNDWWNENGALAALHLLTPLRVEFLKDGLANTGYQMPNSTLPLEGIKIVDIGCGGGLLTEPLAKIGAQVTGIDASAELIDVAKEHAKLDSDILERVKYIHSTIEEFSQRDEEPYDAIIASDVLEHVADPELFIKECVKILKPGGSIFLTTINRTLASWIIAIIAAEYITKLIPRGTHEWNKFITPEEVETMLNKHGCETKSVRGIKGIPFRGQRSWTSSTSVCYALHAVKQKETGVSGDN